ncbi:MAG: 4-(cytidine 5'-diphospho)-2-C-methyl-D-erythritol kinase [Cytophagales bacterium]|nr:4-(cytidine 5'-diphospho)-2-C-methyl-D-erythritol kinase [Cytophagales bacterium]
MLTFPNAKINLGLYVTEKRPDGYHNIESVFYPVGWEEPLEITKSEKTSFVSSGIAIPGSPESNLCLKAYELLKKDFDLPPVRIHLHKTIPIGAGLGGGSADASFTLKLLNEMFSLDLSDEKLEDYASGLGADCPFFIKNRPVLARGTGNLFEPVELDLSAYRLVLVNPGIHVGTAEAYAGVRPKPAPFDLTELLRLPVTEWKGKLHNDFEDSTFPNHPEIARIKENLYEAGALYASMTGSGATVYGIFEKQLNLVFPKSYAIWESVES